MLLLTDCLLFDGVDLRPETGLLIDGERIVRLLANGESAPEGTRVESMSGRLVTPGLVDAHTHLIWGGDRAAEFGRKLNGDKYEDILAEGGGIRSTMRQTRTAGDDDLRAGLRKRLAVLLEQGVTTVEIKSGYGLSEEHELRLLRLVRDVAPMVPQRLTSTLLAAHALPPEFEHDRAAYVRMIIERLIPTVAHEKLAEAVDVFCERGAFTVDEARAIFEAAKAHGLARTIHAEQFTASGGALMAAQHGARSVDHLECLPSEQCAALAATGAVAVLLPGPVIVLKASKPPVAALRAAGVPMAVATDANPGSSPTLRLHLMMQLAAVYFGMQPMEIWRGVTSIAARALGLQNECGVIAPGRRADVVVWDATQMIEPIYRIGENTVRRVYAGGRVVVKRGA